MSPLLCTLIYGWLTVDEDDEQANGDPWRILAVCATSTLLAGAVLSTDRLAAALLLFASALPIAGSVFVLTSDIPSTSPNSAFVGNEQRAEFVAGERDRAGRLAGAFKQLHSSAAGYGALDSRGDFAGSLRVQP